ncbi:methyltransferase family protein [Desulfoscipio gibsoniae]|uniref:methyltransferase family protein n=1 Tax=Desulfoscipio gibsoniae TaxID=102134 RepID=UPI001FE12EF6|nr:isoprenylcysteine carboxylmethyltransferase family protein [Desulfoscipio gibsoniae]
MCSCRAILGSDWLVQHLQKILVQGNRYSFLVKTGVYKYIRHPQYAGLLLLSLGMLAEWATLPMLIFYPVMVVMYVRLAKREEKDMLLEFGGEYREYIQATKMFIPFVV